MQRCRSEGARLGRGQRRPRAGEYRSRMLRRRTGEPPRMEVSRGGIAAIEDRERHRRKSPVKRPVTESPLRSGSPRATRLWGASRCGDRARWGRRWPTVRRRARTGSLSTVQASGDRPGHSWRRPWLRSDASRGSRRRSRLALLVCRAQPWSPVLRGPSSRGGAGRRGQGCPSQGRRHRPGLQAPRRAPRRALPAVRPRWAWRRELASWGVAPRSPHFEV